MPRKFAEFELLELVSSGGMGVIYKAYQESLQKIVAIKMLLLGTHASAELIRRFRIEAVSAGSLHHPNIVRVYDVGLHEGQHYIVMDYVDGQNLSEAVNDKPLAPGRAARYLLKIAQAIEYAHRHGVLHRDIKPSNVLLGQDDEPRVTDFGLAKRFGSDSNATIYGTVTAEGQVLGSPGFMSPEQARGNHSRVGPWSDVYSLGALLYHQLTGRAPFVGASIPETLKMVVEQDPVSPRLLNPAVPRDLETICLRCLEKEPEKRYQTAREVAEELGRFIKDEPIVARPAGRTEKVWRWCRRKPQLSSAIAVATFLFFAGFGVSLAQWHRAEDRAAAVQLNLYVADMNRAHEALANDDRAAALQILLRHQGHRWNEDLRGWEWRYLWQACQPNHHTTMRGSNSVLAIKHSPDSRWVAAACTDGEVILYDWASRTAVKTNKTDAFEYGQIPISFSPSGDMLAIAEPRTIRILRWDAARSDHQEVVLPIGRRPFSLAFSAAGDELYATSANGGFYAWSIESVAPVEPPMTFSNACRDLAVSADGRWLAFATEDSVIAVDMVAKAPVFTNVLGTGHVASIALSKSGLLAVTDRGGHARVWDLRSIDGTCSAREVRSWKAHPSTIHAAAFSLDGRYLATAGNQLVTLWTTANWTRHATLKGGRTEVWTVEFSSNGEKVLAGAKGGYINEWNLSEMPMPATLAGSYYPLWFSTNSDVIGTLTHSKKLQLWSSRDRTLLSSNEVPAGMRSDFVEITEDGEILLVRTSSKVIQVVNRRDGRVKGHLQIDTNAVNSMTPKLCSPKGDTALVTVEWKSGPMAKTIEVFDLASLRPLKVPEPFLSPACFSADGKFLAMANTEEKLVIYDTASWKRTRVLDLDFKPERTMAFSRDGKLLAVGSPDYKIHVLDVARGVQKYVLPGHSEGLGEVLFSRDNRTLFSVATDDLLRLWNVATGQEMFAITDYDGDTFELLLSPDDSVLAVGGIHQIPTPVKLYYAPPLQEIDQILRPQQPNR